MTSAAESGEMLQKARKIVNRQTKEDIYFGVRAKGEARQATEKMKILKGARIKAGKDFQATHFPVASGKWNATSWPFLEPIEPFDTAT